MGIEIRRYRNPGQRLVRKALPVGLTVAVAFCLLAAAQAWVSTSALWADESGIEPKIEPATAVVGETVRLELIIDHEDAGDVLVAEESFPGGIEVERGPFIRPQVPGGGTVIEYDLSGREPGRYVLGPFSGFPSDAEEGTYGGKGFSVVVGGVAKTENSLAFLVGERREGSSAEGKPAVPVPVFWEVPEKPAYAGVPVYLILRAEMLRSADPAFEIALGSGEDAVIDPVETPLPRRPLRFVNGTFYSKVLAAYLFTPFKTGTVSAPQALVRIEGTESRAEPVPFGVSPLPVGEAGAEPGAPVAVGDFDFENRIVYNAGGRTGDGKIILKQRCTGIGNLPFLSFPEPTVTGLVLVNREEERSVIPEPEGYAGWRLRRSVYLPSGPGPKKIVVPEARIFDPESGEERTLPKEEFRPEAVPEVDGSSAAGPSTTGPSAADTEPDAEGGGESTAAAESAENGGAAVPGIYRLIFTKAAARREKQFGSEQAVYTGRAEGMGETAEKLYTLRRLHRLHPMDRALVSIIRQAEREAEVVRSVPVKFMPHPDIFAYLFIAAFILGGFSFFLIPRKGSGREVSSRKGSRRWGFGNRRRGKGSMAAAVIALVVFLANGAAFGITCSKLLTVECIIRTGEPLLKIPAPDSSEYLYLEEGTALEVTDRWEEFVQVKTGNGKTGWLPLSEVVVY